MYYTVLSASKALKQAKKKKKLFENQEDLNKYLRGPDAL
jgi:hypothetical protein